MMSDASLPGKLDEKIELKSFAECPRCDKVYLDILAGHKEANARAQGIIDDIGEEKAMQNLEYNRFASVALVLKDLLTEYFKK